MATYEQLRDRALNFVGSLGESEAQTVAQMALEEAMRFVSFHVRVPALIASATATAPSSPELEANAIALGSGGFGIASGEFQCIDRLYVKQSASEPEHGTPYEYYEYNHFLDLKAVPGPSRPIILDGHRDDERSAFSYTLTPSNKVWAQPLQENNVATLFYRKLPAAYSSMGVPEITPLFDYILVKGAELAVEKFLREPAGVSSVWELFEDKLTKDVQRYESFLNSSRKRGAIKVHRSYRC